VKQELASMSKEHKEIFGLATLEALCDAPTYRALHQFESPCSLTYYMCAFVQLSVIFINPSALLLLAISLLLPIIFVFFYLIDESKVR